MLKRLDSLAAAFLIFAIIFEAIIFVLSDDWFFDLFSHFKWLRHGFETILITWILIRKSRKYGLLWVSLVGASMAVIFCIDALRSSKEALESSYSNVGSVRIQATSFNVLTKNSKTTEVREWLMEKFNSKAVNIVFLMEVNKSWVQDMEILKAKFPYFHEHPREDNFGFAIYSSVPLSNVSIEKFTSNSIPAISTTIRVSGKPVRILGVHTNPPAGEQGYKTRNLYFENLRRNLDQNQIPTLVLGDLNCSPWSKHFEKVIQPQSGSEEMALLSADKKIFRSATWFGAGWIFAIPIDYILYTKEFDAVSFGVGPDLGSDHRPIFSELLL